MSSSWLVIPLGSSAPAGHETSNVPMPEDSSTTRPLPSVRPPSHVVVAVRVVVMRRHLLQRRERRRQVISINHLTSASTLPGWLPAIPARATVGGSHEETDQPDGEHDQRDPPENVHREAEPAKNQSEQQHEQQNTHGLSPPSAAVLPRKASALTLRDTAITSRHEHVRHSGDPTRPRRR